ncbi:hypothetical protein Nepgr_016624 [Nepenthes gracilis]|uniref:Uncharacterized protein n=1 Tax=Nepenthes gracilis TaxID=150966 RepID=A0AAD3SNX9_NEPGR|nr:hypothetical protein Nepgr_016624 [Nepenthes gracilis]
MHIRAVFMEIQMSYMVRLIRRYKMLKGYGDLCLQGNSQNLAGSPFSGTGNGEYCTPLYGPTTSHLQPEISIDVTRV